MDSPRLPSRPAGSGPSTVSPERAQAHFLPCAWSPWRWDSSAEALELRDGTTIAFRVELEQVLHGLGARIVPPFDAVVALLVGARHGPERLARFVMGLAGNGIESDPPEDQGSPSWIDGLSLRARDLPWQAPLDLEHRGVLMESLLEGLRPLSCCVESTTAEHLADHLRAGVDLRRRRDPGINTERFARTLKALDEALERWARLDLSLRRRIGLDGLIGSAGDELFEAEGIRALLDSIRSDPTLCGLGRVSRDLSAALTVPRPLETPDEFPIGGFSDLSNRGDLDRLLVSELAWDDHTLATRVALGEALYLRRESPPAAPPRHRRVLLDVGIRMWGLPRVFATAVGLALAATAAPGAQVAALRADGGRLHAVDLGSREGLLQHLELLRLDPDPRQSLARFVELSGEGDLFVVTEEATLADPDFLAALDAAGPAAIYLVGVHRSGRVALSLRNAHGTQLLGNATIDLEQLTANAADGRSLKLRSAGDGEPALLSMEAPPILFPYSTRDATIWAADAEGAILSTPDGRVLEAFDGTRGARQRGTGLGDLAFLGAQLDSEGLRALLASEDGIESVQLDRGHSGLSRVSLPRVGPKPQDAVHWGEQALLFPAKSTELGAEVAVFDPRSQSLHLREIQRIGPDRPRNEAAFDWSHRHGRFVLGGKRWWALTIQGDAVHATALPETMVRPDDTVLVFETRGVDGVQLVTPSGQLHRLGSEAPPRDLGPPIARMIRASADGDRILLESSSGKRVLLHARRGKLHDHDGVVIEEGAHRFERRTRSPSVPRGLMLGPDRLVLELDAGRTLRIDPDLFQPGQPATHSMTDATLFVFVHTDPVSGFEVYEVRGSFRGKILYDTRGVLHLRPSDPEVPEMALVIGDTVLALWSSRGVGWGRRYLEDDVPIDPPQIRADLEAVLRALS